MKNSAKIFIDFEVKNLKEVERIIKNLQELSSWIKQK